MGGLGLEPRLGLLVGRLVGIMLDVVKEGGCVKVGFVVVLSMVNESPEFLLKGGDWAIIRGLLGGVVPSI